MYVKHNYTHGLLCTIVHFHQTVAVCPVNYRTGSEKVQIYVRRTSRAPAMITHVRTGVSRTGGIPGMARLQGKFSGVERFNWKLRKYFSVSTAGSTVINQKFVRLMKSISGDQSSPQKIMQLVERSSCSFSRDETINMMFRLTKAMKRHHSKGSGSITQYWSATHLDRICRNISLSDQLNEGVSRSIDSSISADQLSMLLYSIQCLPMSARSGADLRSPINQYVTMCSDLLTAATPNPIPTSVGSLDCGGFGTDRQRYLSRRLIAVSLTGLRYRSPTTDPGALAALTNIVRLLTVHIRMGAPTSASLLAETSSYSGSGSGSTPVSLAMLGEQLFTPRSISNSLCGVGSLASQPAVQDLVAALAGRLKAEQAILRAHSLSAAESGPGVVNQCKSSGGEYMAFQWDRTTLSNTLYALKNYSSNDPAVRELLSVLGSLVAEPSLVPVVTRVKTGSISGSSAVSGAPALSLSDISFACSGLQNMHSKHLAVREYLRVCMIPTLKAVHDFSDLDHLSRHIGTSLYGFRDMSTSHHQVRLLVKAFDQLVLRAQQAQRQRTESSTELAEPGASNGGRSGTDLSYVDIGNMVYGLQGLSSGVVEVQSLVRRLAGIIAAPPGSVVASGGHLTPRLLAMCGYGLKSFSADDSAVRALLGALLPHIEEFIRLQRLGDVEVDSSGRGGTVATPANALLTPRQLSNMIYGARGLSSSHKVVRSYLRLLAALVIASHGNGMQRFNAQDMSNTLYGFQSLSSGSFEVRWLLAALTPCLQTYRPNPHDSALSGQAVSNCFYGLKRLANDSREVDGLLVALGDVLGPVADGRYRVELSAQHVGNILYGVQLMSAFSDWDPAGNNNNSNSNNDSTGVGGGDPKVYGSGRVGDSSQVFRERICPVLTRLLEGCVFPGGGVCVLEGQELANSVFGLKSLSLGAFLGSPVSRDGRSVRYEDAAPVCLLLDAVSEVIERSCGLALADPGVAAGPSDSDAAVAAATPASSPIIIDAQEFAMIYYGLQGLHACPLEASAELEVLPPETRLRLRVQHDRATAASRRLIRSLLPSLSTCTEPVTYSELSMCCYGLRECSSSFVEVRDLVGLLAQRIQRFGLVASRSSSSVGDRRPRSVYSSEGAVLRTSVHLYPYQISKLFRGLQNCSSEHAEVRQLLTLLTPLLKVHPPVLNKTGVAADGRDSGDTPSPFGPGPGAIQRRRPAAVGPKAPPAAMVMLLHDEQVWKESMRQGAHHQSKDGFSLSLPEVLTGLRNMSHDHAEVQALLEQLAQHVDQ